MRTAYLFVFFVLVSVASSNAEEIFEVRLAEGETVSQVVNREATTSWQSEFVQVVHPRYDDVVFGKDDAIMRKLPVGTRIRIDRRFLRPVLKAVVIPAETVMQMEPLPVVSSAVVSDLNLALGDDQTSMVAVNSLITWSLLSAAVIGSVSVIGIRRRRRHYLASPPYAPPELNTPSTSDDVFLLSSSPPLLPLPPPSITACSREVCDELLEFPSEGELASASP